MIFEEIRDGGCCSYLIGCPEAGVVALVDPGLGQFERAVALAARRGLRVQCVVDTHTHADHFSAARVLRDRLDAPTVMHRASPAPFVDVRVEDGECIALGALRLQVIHTPGHTADSICLVAEDQILTGDTLLLGSVGRTDLPTGDAEALYDSLTRLLARDQCLVVSPAHNYKGTPATTLAEQKATNPRIAGVGPEEFATRMRELELGLPEHLTEALRTNASGGKPVSQLIREAARGISFMCLDELGDRLSRGDPGVAIIDVREGHAYAAGHIPGARHMPRGQLELSVDRAFPDPSTRILTYCEYGKISTLAAATLRAMGFSAAVALDGGFEDWVAAGHPVEAAIESAVRTELETELAKEKTT